MPYTVEIPRSVRKEIARFPVVDGERIVAAIRGLATVPRPPNCTRLTGRDGWRIRIGEYRIVYDIDDQNQRVIIIRVGQRGSVYR
ncbi:MAG: hypothetical protein NVS4B8_27610 [Herpetosiphon sp.]